VLDATKAFHRVSYCKLFNSLIERDLPFVTIRLLSSMYKSHATRVLRNGIYSNFLLIMNEVKQGGIVSLILSCVYLDGLPGMLNNSKLGCHVGDLCLAALGYADYMVLLAPTVMAMRVLLKIFDDFGANYVVFNASQSKCVITKPSCGRNMILERIPTTTFQVGGVEIEFLDS
jgi:Reverse transcriptase (RNA-dependent DNA polymerase)